MGKNRKPRNVADQVQEQNETILEIKSDHLENSEDFLISDDFCIVQKKKGSKKSDSDSLLTRSRSYFGKKISNDEGCYMSFWTCKSNGTANGCSTSIDSSDSACQSHEQLDNPLVGSHFYSNGSVESNENDLLKYDVGVTEDIVKKVQLNSLIDSGISSENGENMTIENLETEELFDNLSDKDKAVKGISSDEIVVVENPCCMKKQNKKKEFKKKPVDEEVERLLKELEGDEQNCVLPSPICASYTHFNQNSQYLTCTNVSTANNASINVTNRELEKPMLLNRKLDSEFANACNLSSDFKGMNISVSDHNSASDSVSVEMHVKSSSQKKKRKEN